MRRYLNNLYLSNVALHMQTIASADIYRLGRHVAYHSLGSFEKKKDIPLIYGISSAATMGFLVEASLDSLLRKELGQFANCQAVLSGLKGATHPEMYQRLASLSPEAVNDAQKLYLS